MGLTGATGAAILLATSALTASAQPAKLDCDKAMANAELNACEQLELEKADRELNAAYRAMLAHVDASGLEAGPKAEWRKAVQDAQRQWIALRDADCNGAVPFEMHGGTGATLLALGCSRAMAVERARELRRRANL